MLIIAAAINCNFTVCGAVDTFNGTFKNGAKDVFHDGLDRL